MFCNKCGTENEEESKFCSSCGNSFEGIQTKGDGENTTEESDKETETKEESKLMAYGSIFVGVFMVLGFLNFVFGGTEKGKEEMCSSLFNVMESNKNVDTTTLSGQLLQKDWVKNCLRTDDSYVDQQYKEHFK